MEINKDFSDKKDLQRSHTANLKQLEKMKEEIRLTELRKEAERAAIEANRKAKDTE